MSQVPNSRRPGAYAPGGTGVARTGTMNDMQHPDPDEPADAGGVAEHDPMSAVDENDTYLPPMDPVEKPDAHGNPQIVGGFSADSMSDELPMPRPVTGGSPDEALAVRVRRDLLEDAATTDLEIEVEVVDGTAFVRGRVSDLVDVDNVIAVAGRVQGIVDVVDELAVGD